MPINPVQGHLAMMGLTPEQLAHNIAVSEKNLDMHQETKNLSYKAINYILFAVGSGTFVLSINYLGNTHRPLEIPYVLIAAWIFLLCSIAGQCLVHVMQIKQSARQIYLNNLWRRERFARDIEEMANGDERLQDVVRWGNRFSLLVFVALLLGVSSLTYFVSYNLLKQSENQQELTSPNDVAQPLNFKG